MTLPLPHKQFCAIRQWLTDQKVSYNAPPKKQTEELYKIELADSDYERLCENEDFLKLKDKV
jgi:hypothetical protein